MGSYNYTANTDYQALNMSFKRISDTQLIDITAMFNSYTDALKYAQQNRRNPDERRLYKASYVGQVITVYEDGVITQYKINEQRGLDRLIPLEKIKVNGEEVSPVDAIVDIEVPSFESTEDVHIETTGSTSQIEVMKVDCGEY